MRCPYSAGVRSGGSRPSDKGGGWGSVIMRRPY